MIVWVSLGMKVLPNDPKKTSQGGCNGCLNVNNSDNKGLEDIVSTLETVYQENNFGEIISRADMWALMGIWAINNSISRNNEDCTL